MDSKIKIAELNDKLLKLVESTYNILEETDNVELKEKLIQELKELENRTDLKVAFAGQYSSGKSTIISALTGNKSIKIDANVATDAVAEYRWQNIVLMDTPGILAGKLEKHDEVTKEALKNCDLIVYVITSQLFDDIIFENFIDLAYTQRLKDKMLIAVNKMSMESGQFDELKDNYLNSIRTIFKERGYDFDSEIVFIDAADYIEGTEDQDDEFVKLSNFSTFIATLNSFVERKGIIKKQFDTPVRLLKGSIADIVLAQTSPDLQVLLKQGINRIKAAKKGITNDLKIQTSNLKQSIMDKGFELGNLIGEVEENVFKKEESDFNFFVEKQIDKTLKEIEEIIKREEEDIIKELSDFGEKESVKSFIDSIDNKLSAEFVSPQVQVNLEKQKNVIDFLTKGGNKLVNASVKDSALNGLKAVSGSETHKTIYSVGKFFGHKFKPWEAVKTAGKVGKVAKFAGPILGVVSIGLDVYANEKEERQRIEIQKAKNRFFTTIKEFADNIVEQIKKGILEYITNSYDQKMEDLNNQIVEIVNNDSTNSKLKDAINKLDTEYIEFIEIIEKE